MTVSACTGCRVSEPAAQGENTHWSAGGEAAAAAAVLRLNLDLLDAASLSSHTITAARSSSAPVPLIVPARTALPWSRACVCVCDVGNERVCVGVPLGKKDSLVYDLKVP